MNDAPSFSRAQDDLQYIRRTLDEAGRLSSISGRGLMAVGFLALGAVAANHYWTGAPWDPAGTREAALAIWGVVLLLALATGAWSMERKARRAGQVLWSPVLRRALWSYGSAMVLGGVLTLAALRLHYLDLIPAVWLGCYGVAVTSAGVFSVSPVRWMGISFLILSLAGVLAPAGAGLALLGAGFGWLHIAFGAYIAWRHDG